MRCWVLTNDGQLNLSKRLGVPTSLVLSACKSFALALNTCAKYLQAIHDRGNEKWRGRGWTGGTVEGGNREERE